MKRIVVNFEHKASYASVDEAFTAYVAEAHKLDTVLAQFGLSIWSDSTTYAIGIKDSNDVIKPFLVMVFILNGSAVAANASIRFYKSGTFEHYMTSATRKLTSSDTYYGIMAGIESTSAASVYPYCSASYYAGDAYTTVYWGEHKSSSASPEYGNLYHIGGSVSRFLSVTVFYNDDSMYMCYGYSNATSVNGRNFLTSCTLFKKANEHLYVFPRYQYGNSIMNYTNSSGYNGYYGFYYSSFSVYDELHPENGTYTMIVSFGNRELDGDTEKAVVQEVQIDAEGTTLGDEVYVGKIPAPNGRYYINNKPYFFINGLGVKDED